MQITILGSGPAAPTRDRASAGHLLEWDDRACLLDASAGTYMRALRAGLDPRRLSAVLLTHFHPDHTADLAGLLWARRNQEIEAPLTVAGPEGTADLLARTRAVYGDLLDTPVEVEGYPCAIDGLRADAFPARHSPEAVCLRLTVGGRIVAFSGDTGDCDGLRAACADADLALIECTESAPKEGHMTPVDCEAVVAAARPRRVVLVHLGPDIASALPMAEDGMVIPL